MFLFSKKNQFFQRTTAIFLLMCMLCEIIFPSAALALTSGGTQPEVSAYQPVDATDNVNLVNGRFNYTIPITSIPEYPMAIGYNNGASMEQEAGVFGLGFSSFTGAVARSMAGLPDDMNNGKVEYKFENQRMWDGNLGYSFSVPLSELGLSTGNYSISPSIGATFGYNNYTGTYGALSLGLGIGRKLGKAMVGGKNLEHSSQFFAGVQASVTIDSRSSSILFGAGAGLGISMSNVNTREHIGSASLAAFGISKALDGKNSKMQKGGHILGVSGKSSFGLENRASLSTLSSTAYVVPNTSSYGVNLSVPVPTVPGLTINGSLNYFNFGYENIKKRAFGFEYLNGHYYDIKNTEHLADMTVEGEDSYNEDSRNNPAHLQYDNFCINTMGLSGSMRMFQTSYGLVARNTQRQQRAGLGALGYEMNSTEVKPWYNVTKSKYNSGIDIIGLLKDANKGINLDIDKVMFVEQEKEDFSYRKFKDVKLKMRGDMAGEYNLASDDYKDHEPNTYSLNYINETDDWRFVLLGVENGIPQYYPTMDYPDNMANQNASPISRGTVIKKKTVNQILANFNQYKDVDPNATATGNPSNPTDPFFFNQSIFAQYTSKSEVSTDPNPGYKPKYFYDNLYNSNLRNLNILNHLQDIKNDNPEAGDVIGSIEVQNTSGLKYYFGLPAFVKKSVDLQLQGKGEKAPEYTAQNYYSYDGSNGQVNRAKLTTIHDYAYPYAWLLTAIVGDDYIDFDNIPGPSDGDIGYWVKFKYIKATDNYKWRFPFNGLGHFSGKYHTTGDDMYSFSYGEKEIYYISEIESAGYRCRYQYGKRFDGLEAAGLVAGKAYNTQYENESISGDPAGEISQYAVTQIDLFKKHRNGFNSEPYVNSQNVNNWYLKAPNSTGGTASRLNELPVKTTKFFYDYSQCPKVPNNAANYRNITVYNVPYHVSYDDVRNGSATDHKIGTGKLTLRKVQHIAYEEGGKGTALPSYTFDYFGDTQGQDQENPISGSQNLKYNPPYDRQNYDQWGSYYANSKDVQSRLDGASGTEIGNCNYYTHYTEYVKSQADDNAKVYNLKKINLPSGGEMEIDYQAQNYGFVEDKTPFAMRHVLKIEELANQNKVRLYVDITDLREVDPNLDLTKAGAVTRNAAGEEKPIVAAGDLFYGEMAFFRNTKNHDPSNLFISGGRVRVITVEPTVISSSDYKGSRYYQAVVVEAFEDADNPTGFDPHFMPYTESCRQYMYAESFESRAVKESLSIPFNCSNANNVLQQYEDLEKDTPLDALRKMISTVKNTFTSNQTFKNNFHSCYGVPATDIYPHYSYFCTRIFKAKYTGSMVKSIKLRDNFNYATDPSQTNGYKQNANEYGTNYYYDLKDNSLGTSSGVTALEPGGGPSCVIDQLKTNGAGFMSGPGIYFSRSSVENIYQKPETNTSQTGDIVSREKGKTIYEFYTAKDDGMQFGRNFRTGPYVNAPGPAKGSFNLFGVLLFITIKINFWNSPKEIKIPFAISPIFVNWRRQDKYYIKAYSYTDYTDMFGRPKSIIQQDEKGQQIGQQKFTYYDFDEPVDVYKDNFNAPTTIKKPGKMDQVWSESYYTKRTKANFYTVALAASTERKFAYTNMKYSYFPPVLKKIESTFDGISSSTENTGFDYFTGTPIDIRSSDSYGNTKIARTVPAYWLSSNKDMGSNDADEGKVNNLTATAQTYMYLNTISNSSLLGAGVVTWEAGNQSPKKWNTAPYLQPGLMYIDNQQVKYNYTFVNGASIQNAYNYQAYQSDANSKPISRNKNIFKPYNGYTYEVPLSTNGTFSTFTPFANSAAAGWKLISTNELYAANGVLLQTKDVLGKYAAQQLGYNFSNTMGAYSNASWGAAIHEGAENNYIDYNTNTTMLEDNRMKLGDAKILRANKSQSISSASFCYNTVGGTTYRSITIQLPSNAPLNTPLFKIEVSYSLNNLFSGGNQSISQYFLVSLTNTKQFEIITDQGFTYKGFYSFTGNNNTYKLYFPGISNNPGTNNVFTKFVVSPIITGPSYSYTYTANDVLPACTGEGYPCVPYKLYPDRLSEVHTGLYAFKLDAGKSGCSYLIHPTNTESPVPVNEYKRKYKAMVWVHNSSPLQTELVAKITNSTNPNVSAPNTPPYATYTTSMASPYLKAGDWSLLRLEFDLSNINPNQGGNNYYALVYIRNNSALATAIFDDIRVLPYYAEGSNWVYEPYFNRLSSGLDNDNFASYSTYDARGRAVTSAIELQNEGKKTIQRFLYNDQKKK